MEFTGERVLPGEVEPDLYNEHLVRYLFARQFASRKMVLDLGCGAGYGSTLIAEVASKVIGLDVSQEAIKYARENFSAANLHYIVTDGAFLGLAPGSFDLVLCFEVIEHLTEQEFLLEEIRRVLKPDGILVISTPNRLFYTEERKLVNPYHTHEFDYAEFREFLGRYFAEVEVDFQNHISSIYVGDAGKPLKVLCQLEEDSGKMQSTSNFFVAICSETAKNYSAHESLVYLTSTGNLLREKEQRIESLEVKQKELNQKVLQLQGEYDQRTRWCLELNETVRERDATVLKLQQEYRETMASLREALAELQQEFEERTLWAQRLSLENSEKAHQILRLQNEFDERTAWAIKLDSELKRTREQLEKIRLSRLYQLSKALRLVPKI